MCVLTRTWCGAHRTGKGPAGLMAGREDLRLLAACDWRPESKPPAPAASQTTARMGRGLEQK
jgi:hypothetical protein